AEIEYELNGEILAKTASLAIADNNPLIDSDAAILVPYQTKDGWESTGRYSLYLGEEVLRENSVVVITSTEFPGSGPDLQFKVEFIQISEPTFIGDDLREQDLNPLNKFEPEFESPAYLEVNLDGYIDLTNIPAGKEAYVATFDEEHNVWVKVPILEEDIDTNSIVVAAAHFST